MTNDILYSFRRCPYAIRARWALLICEIKVEIREIDLKNKPVFSVQYHPESNPGPQDSVYLFQEFINNIKKNAKKKRY